MQLCEPLEPRSQPEGTAESNMAANVEFTIEIISNTREGIVMFIQAKKGNASNGEQKIQMLK